MGHDVRKTVFGGLSTTKLFRNNTASPNKAVGGGPAMTTLKAKKGCFFFCLFFFAGGGGHYFGAEYAHLVGSLFSVTSRLFLNAMIKAYLLMRSLSKEVVIKTRLRN